MTNVVVTGAGGYVGGRLVQRLDQQGWSVTSVVRDQQDMLDGSASAVVLDLADDVSDELTKHCKGAEAVIHLAGPSEVVAATSPDEALRETVLAALHVGRAAADAGVRRVVYLSTVHVYGRRFTDDEPLAETVRPEPRSIYAVSRLAGEHVLASLLDTAALAVLRLSNAVGAPAASKVDRWTLVTNDLAREAVTGGTATLRTAGLQNRDFIGLADVCRVIEAAADPQLLPAGTYNLASGRQTTIRQLAELVCDEVERQAGRRPALVAPDPVHSEPTAFRLDISALEAHGLGDMAPLSDAVAETVAFCIAHQDLLAETGDPK